MLSTSIFRTFCLALLLGMMAARGMAAERINYEVRIEAPVQFKQLLQAHLDIVKWQDHPRMSPVEWERLSQDTPQAIAELLATEGYFSPHIKRDSLQENTLLIAAFEVNPGSRTQVTGIDIRYTRDSIPPDAQRPALEALVRQWALKPGQPFRQEDWDAAKKNILSALILERYPTARIAESRAAIDPEQHTAALVVVLESGPPFTFGALTIEGLQRYPRSIVDNLNPIQPGSPYSQTRLLDFQSLLQQTGYFSSVEVFVEPDPEHPDRMPIHVRVQEAPAVKLGLGLGFSTNTGARAQITFDDKNLLDRGWRLESSLKLETLSQSLTGQVALPTTREGYRDSISTGLLRTDIEDEETRTLRLGVQRAWGPTRTEHTVGAAFDLERKILDGESADDSHALAVFYGIQLRRTNSLTNPTRGYLLNLRAATAPLEVLATQPFLQTQGKWQGYFLLTPRTQLILRSEIGAVTAGGLDVPSAYLFRTGGDQSVRGYAYQSLGVERDDAIVGGKYLFTASAEIVQWLTEHWGAALFYDLGNATDRFSELDPVSGYGLGVRWKSPAGVLGADLAYGRDTGEYRLHFSLGVAF